MKFNFQVKQFMSSTKKKLVRMGESDKKDSRQSSIRSDERSRYDEQYHSKVVPRSQLIAVFMPNFLPDSPGPRHCQPPAVVHPEV